MKSYLRQKYGSFCSLDLTVVYHRSTAFEGIKVSLGWGVICDWVTAKEDTKFTKFSARLSAKDKKDDAAFDAAVLVTGVCCERSCNGSTDMPIWAICVEWAANGLSLPVPEIHNYQWLNWKAKIWHYVSKQASNAYVFISIVLARLHLHFEPADSPVFSPDTLKITLGFSLVMKPRSDQPVSGQQKWTVKHKTLVILRIINI